MNERFGELGRDEPLIAVSELAKHFAVRRRPTVRAVDGVTFSVAPGELVGYLGPNGAGKSTTLKMLTGLLVPTSGDVTVAGRIPWRERRAHVATIGAVFGQRTSLWWDLPVIESFDLLRYIYRIPPERYRANLDAFRDLLDLDAFLQSPVRSLSLGQRMRADFAAAMLHDPDVLFLDEPTIGLDVVAKERVRRFIRHLNAERGTTVLLTTHDLADVERLCDRVLIIDGGRLLYDGNLTELQRRFGGRRELVVDLAEDVDGAADAGGDVRLDDARLAVHGAEVIARDGPRITYAFDRDATTAADLIARVTQRLKVVDLALKEPDIETTVRRIYEERLLDA
ncbi:MAG: ATP-binding cassette domain-containing protein [Ardenticatenales bacterium]|jgi:ABC-2 type transport system ATP-binding protein|nr:ATP-binding cassette domain-containing protein [Ardenticatenales bacterium]